MYLSTFSSFLVALCLQVSSASHTSQSLGHLISFSHDCTTETKKYPCVKLYTNKKPAELCCDWLKDVVKLCDCKTAHQQESTNQRRTLKLRAQSYDVFGWKRLSVPIYHCTTVRVCDREKANVLSLWLAPHHQVHTAWPITGQLKLQSYVVIGCMVVWS